MRVWPAAGRLGYWLVWPLMWIYLRDSERTRLLLINDMDKLLVVKGWLAGSNRWALPGGGIRKGESPQQCLLREVTEEVGLTLQENQIKLLRKASIKSKGFRFHLHIFTCRIVGEPAIKLQRSEIVTAAWVDIRCLNDKNAEPDIMLALAGLPEV